MPGRRRRPPPAGAVPPAPKGTRLRTDRRVQAPEPDRGGGSARRGRGATAGRQARSRRSQAVSLALAGTAEGNYACRYHALSSRRVSTPAAAVAWKEREDQPSIAARSNSDGSREP